MLFHVILTTECNLQCRYCFGEALKDVDADFPEFGKALRHVVKQGVEVYAYCSDLVGDKIVLK